MTIIPCRYCSKAIDFSATRQQRIVRCPKCSKLNLLLNIQQFKTIQFDRYELLEEVGEGANAIVCRARIVNTEEIAAIKLFHSEPDTNCLSKREFLREIEFSLDVQHENIVRTRLGSETEGILFLELEFVDGINLAQYVEHCGAMDAYEALDVGIQVACALDFVWSSYRSIHRDIKPQNIMISANGVVKICDFGMVTAQESALVDVSAVDGTPYYLSPECVIDGAFQDNRSDIYSLGATLFHLVTATPPFDDDSLMKVINARLEKDTPDIRDILPHANENVAKVISSMMAKDVDKRYATANDCLEDMVRVRNGEPPIL